jgi:hypothetical protein
MQNGSQRTGAGVCEKDSARLFPFFLFLFGFLLLFLLRNLTWHRALPPDPTIYKNASKKIKNKTNDLTVDLSTDGRKVFQVNVVLLDLKAEG